MLVSFQRLWATAVFLPLVALAKIRAVVYIVDGSGSIDNSEWKLQRRGIEAALLDPSVVPRDGSVAVGVVQFDSVSRVEIPLQVVTQANAAGIASTAATMNQLGGLTGPGVGMNGATSMVTSWYNAQPGPNPPLNDFADVAYCMVTDGLINTGPSVASAHSTALSTASLDFFAVLAITTSPSTFEAEYNGFVTGGGQVVSTAVTTGAANMVGDFCFPVLPGTVELVGIEVTQAIQDLKNTVKLVANKKTLVRAYFLSKTGQPERVKAVLKAYRGSTQIGQTEGMEANYPSTGQTAINAQSSATGLELSDRVQLSKSLNFVFNQSNTWTDAGTIRFEVESVGGSLDCNDPGQGCDATVQFETGKTFKVVMVRLSVTLSTGTTYLPNTTHVNELRNRLLALFPTASISPSTDILSFTSTNPRLTTSSDLPSGSTVVPDDDIIHAQLQQKQASDCSQTPSLCGFLYYGVLDPALHPSLYSSFGFELGGVSLGLSLNGAVDGRNTHGHELAHAAGVPHPLDRQGTLVPNAYGPGFDGYRAACGGARSPDTGSEFPYLSTVPNYTARVPTIGPFPSPREDVIVGWDSNQNSVMDPKEKFALMSYCGPDDKWTSHDTYDKVFSYIDSNFRRYRKLGGEPRVLSDPLCLFSARADLDNPSQSDVSLLQLSGGGAIPSSIQSPTGSWSLVLEDTGGNALETLTFEPEFPDDGADAGYAYGFVATVCPAGFGAFVLADPTGLEVGRTTASANPPAVTVVFPNGGESLNGDSVTVEWSASDADAGDELTASVAFSPDGGATWSFVAFGVVGDSVTIPLSALGQSSSGLFRVQVSDGFLTGEDTSDATFITPNTEPFVSINYPPNDSIFSGVQDIVFEASTSDAEDGTVSNVGWSSDINGFLGSGSSFSVRALDLAEAIHTITVQATDSAGASVTDLISVDIRRIAPTLDDPATAAPSPSPTQSPTFSPSQSPTQSPTFSRGSCIYEISQDQETECLDDIVESECTGTYSGVWKKDSDCKEPKFMDCRCRKAWLCRWPSRVEHRLCIRRRFKVPCQCRD